MPFHAQKRTCELHIFIIFLTMSNCALHKYQLNLGALFKMIEYIDDIEGFKLIYAEFVPLDANTYIHSILITIFRLEYIFLFSP